jgi:hypothetical protein
MIMTVAVMSHDARLQLKVFLLLMFRRRLHCPCIAEEQRGANLSKISQKNHSPCPEVWQKVWQKGPTTRARSGSRNETPISRCLLYAAVAARGRVVQPPALRTRRRKRAGDGASHRNQE